MTEYDLFVPGRLCILGEHTDWAGQYIDQSIYLTNYQNQLKNQQSISLSSYISSDLCGYTVVCTTNEGIYIKCKAASDFKGLIYRYIDHSNVYHEIRFEYSDQSLTSIARSDRFYSYVVGTLMVLLDRYVDKITDGIDIYNYLSTLPVKKGLSSSAAICVSVVKSFDHVFDLKLTRDEIMDIAFLGEMNTPSKCGRMDQCVAMGKDSIALMTFNRSNCQLIILPNKSTIYFVVADLNASKDTVVILGDLNDCFPHPNNQTQEKMHEYVADNVYIVNRAIVAIETGDISSLAEAITQSQELFDDKVSPNCPSQLAAPRLHSLFNDDILRSISLAMKGVGSQGDGSIQILCSNTENQSKVLIRLKELNCEGFPLTIAPHNKS